MENKIILLDTSVLIDYFRKKDESKTLLYKLTGKNKLFAISAISEFEIYRRKLNSYSCLVNILYI